MDIENIRVKLIFEKNCPTRKLCTKSEDYVKVVTRHIWNNYEELAEDIRYTPK